MENLGADNNLSSSIQTTLAVGGALALVVGVVIHQNKDRLSSLFVENLASEEMNQNTDWEKLTISAQVSFGCVSMERIFCGRSISFSSYLNHVIPYLHYIQSSLKHLKCFKQNFMRKKNEWNFFLFRS